MQKLNEQKAKLLYDAIAQSNGFYSNPVEASSRSLMNVPFTIPSNPDLEKTFIKETEKAGMVSIMTSSSTSSSTSPAPSSFYHCKQCTSNLDFFLFCPFLLMMLYSSQLQLKGHRSVGGMRASIYNAVPLEGVQALVTFMKVCSSDPKHEGM